MTTYLPTFEMEKKASSSKILIGNEICFLCKHVAGRGASEKVSAVGFCLGSGLFGSCNSD